MIYKIKEIEGVDHFLKTHSAYDLGSKPTSDYNFNSLFGDNSAFGNNGKNGNGLAVKPGFLKAGDQLVIVLTEYTNYTRQQVLTETLFDVIKHDDFLLKIVKQTTLGELKK